MAKSKSDMFDTMRLGWSMARLGLEAQTVMAIRIAGLAGLMVLPPGEAMRMVQEKGPAFSDAWMKGAVALASGAGVPAAMGLALKPLHRKAQANRKRLTRSGKRR
jgi:hypothetical protein